MQQMQKTLEIQIIKTEKLCNRYKRLAETRRQKIKKKNKKK